ncbi:MAG: response regulator transcription factor [Lachnospiraceae bacterium]|nr:response regulator transcription factor [Lachnospiraceae bacterium]
MEKMICRKRILIVEDDTALANGLCRALTSSDMEAECVGTLHESKNYIKKNLPDLVLLDVNLPDGNGFDYLRELKSSHSFPVILLTANDMESDIVSGLEMGADDYITKPFSLAILRARINTRLRKIDAMENIQENMNEKTVVDQYVFDFKNMEFYWKEERVELSKTEQKLLRIFVENQGITLSRADLVDRIWTDGAEYVEENALSVTIKRLRDKLHANAYIKTVYGIGYMWVKL